MYQISELFKLRDAELKAPQTFSGRGVLICAGGALLPSAFIAVRSLRYFGCNLPIQIWHIGPNELIRQLIPAFERWGVEFIDCLPFFGTYPMRCFGGWQSKPFSIVNSRFAEVLLLDADNMALRDPTFLLDHELYRSRGAIFWPDFPVTAGDFWQIKPSAWKILSLEPAPGSEIESGQLLIDKISCWKPLLLSLHMNSNSDFYYQHCTHGDKDTFTLSWKLAGREPFLISKRPSMQNSPVRIQFGPDDQPLFQHSRKWSLPAKLNPNLSQFLFEPLALEWLRELESESRKNN